ncbi:MAG: homoserine kinase [Egibacteraceae bacterium]
MSPDDIVGVEVPASTANLGPGFDTLAAAVDLRLTAWTTDREDRRVIAAGEGAEELPSDDDNLVWQALLAYCERFDAAVPEVSLRAHSAIPLERGLGSSSAAAVAGVALARALTRAGGSDQDLIDLAGELEGHPDNAAAAVIGGVVAVVDGRAHRFEPSPGLRPVVCIPTERQSTSDARGLLPAVVPFAEAAATAGRAALTLAGLTGAAALRPEAMHDVLHEPARFEAMPDSGALVTRLREDGMAACLSGAGPSVLAVVGVRDARAAERVAALAGQGWQVHPAAWDRAGAAVCPPTVVARPAAAAEPSG